MIYVILSYFCPLSTMKWKHSQGHTAYFHPSSNRKRSEGSANNLQCPEEEIDITNRILDFFSSVVNEKREKRSWRALSEIEWLHSGRRGNERSSRASKWIQRILAIFMCLHKSETDGSDESWMKSNYLNGALWVRTSSEFFSHSLWTWMWCHQQGFSFAWYGDESSSEKMKESCRGAGGEVEFDGAFVAPANNFFSSRHFPPVLFNFLEAKAHWSCFVMY